MYAENLDYVKNNPEYAAMIESMKQEIEHFMKCFADDSRLISGWGHGYFCESDGGRLIYDINKPFEHRCSICGKQYRDYRFNACFVTMMRNEVVVTAVKSAIIYQLTGDTSYSDLTKAIIAFYAERYSEFVVHAKDKVQCSPTEDVGGAGKIMPQGLNEAIIAIRMINAMELIKDQLESEWLIQVKESLFDPIVQLLLPQKMHIHNIPTWINSAIGVIGFFFNEQDWIKEATVQPYHLIEQLQQGVTASGFWYEGSIHYHFFVLEGMMNFMIFAKVYQYPLADEFQQIVLHMLDAAYHYAFDNDIFPNPSDGWPNVGLKTYSYVYDMAYKVFGDPIIPYLQHIEQSGKERSQLPLSEPYYYQNKIPLERLLFAPDVMTKDAPAAPMRKSSSFETSNCAILRNDRYNVFFKYGHQTQSHSHPDKMNIEIIVDGNVLTKDLSNSGYASKMCNQWHRKIASHNTCVWNGQDSDLISGGKLSYVQEDSIKATCQAYDLVSYHRELKLVGAIIYDTFIVEAKEEGVIDWFFHFETAIDETKLSLGQPIIVPEYPLIHELKEIQTDGMEMIIDHQLVTMELKLEPTAKVYYAKTYNNPADQMRDTIMIRKKGQQARVETIITAK